MLTTSNVTVMENDGIAVIQVKRTGPLNEEILVNISTVNGTALGEVLFKIPLINSSVQLV